MNILILTKKFPYPLTDGDAISISNLCKALRDAGCTLTLLSMDTTKHPVGEIPAHYDTFKAIHLVKVDNHVKPLDALRNLLFTNESYHISRFDTPEYKAKLQELLKAEHFDAVHLETLFIAPYAQTVRDYSPKSRLILRAHNVEHEIWERITAHTRFLPKKWYLQILTKRLRDYEIKQLNVADAVLTVTQRDLDTLRGLGCKVPGMCVPAGLDFAAFPPKKDIVLAASTQQPTLGFIGTLDWLPNEEGVRWMLNEVWAKVRAAVPSAALHIAGRNTPEWLQRGTWAGVTVHGEVPDANAFLLQHAIIPVPILSGSGMRVKIIEAMAMGRVVVSTPVGIEGIAAKDKVEAFYADGAEAFANTLIDLLQAPEKLPAVSAAARDFVEGAFSNAVNAQKVLHFYRETLELK